jgi:hypothetical protein
MAAVKNLSRITKQKRDTFAQAVANATGTEPHDLLRRQLQSDADVDNFRRMKIHSKNQKLQLRQKLTEAQARLA